MLGVLAALILAAGCGGEEAVEERAPATEPPATTQAVTQEAQPEPLETQPGGTLDLAVYFLRDGKIAAARREVPVTQAVARAALEALAAGPTALEREAGLTSDVPESVRIERLAVAGGTAQVELSSCAGFAQVVYTLTRVPGVERVESECGGGTRADYESVTPPIFVESPTVGESVTSPLRLHGTSTTFEATFMYELADSDGRIVAKDFVTATTGNGERGTFDVEIPFDVDRPGGALIVYEASAEDNSRLHLVEIPLRLEP